MAPLATRSFSESNFGCADSITSAERSQLGYTCRSLVSRSLIECDVVTNGCQQSHELQQDSSVSHCTRAEWVASIAFLFSLPLLNDGVQEQTSCKDDDGNACQPQQACSGDLAQGRTVCDKATKPLFAVHIVTSTTPTTPTKHTQTCALVAYCHPLVSSGDGICNVFIALAGLLHMSSTNRRCSDASHSYATSAHPSRT